tara:strand:+ start:245 stop:448 length:204 start_codon:yes stop_codon:yes gene_type:complete
MNLGILPTKILCRPALNRQKMTFHCMKTTKCLKKRPFIFFARHHIVNNINTLAKEMELARGVEPPTG